jgi:hypothetical protein
LFAAQTEQLKKIYRKNVAMADFPISPMRILNRERIKKKGKEKEYPLIIYIYSNKSIR